MAFEIVRLTVPRRRKKGEKKGEEFANEVLEEMKCGQGKFSTAI